MDRTPITAPIPRRGKLLAALICAGILGMWIAGFMAYFASPGDIPTRYTSMGQPVDFVSKAYFFVLPAIFCLAPIGFLLITKHRFAVSRAGSTMTQLAAFVTEVEKLPADQQGTWINTYFEKILALGVSITVILFVIEAVVYHLYFDGLPLPWWVVIVALAAMIASIALFLLSLNRLLGKVMEAVESPLKE